MASEGFERHPIFWMHDGSVVLIAENTGFKVHQSILSMHSEFFRDLFSLPQPQVSEESTEGCPVVRMMDESAEEVITVLRILYDGARSYYKDTTVLPFFTIVTALRLGTKYLLHDIRKEAVARLSACFPPTLDAFHNGVAMTEIHPRPAHLLYPEQCPIDMEAEDAITVLHLAYSFDLKELVPAAIYTCAQLPASTLFAAHRKTGPLGSLTLDELQECIETRLNLHSDSIAMYRFLSKGEVSGACEKNGCVESMMLMASSALECEYTDSPDPLLSLNDWIEGPVHGLCKHCVYHALMVHEQDRQRVWDRLRAKSIPAPTMTAMDDWA